MKSINFDFNFDLDLIDFIRSGYLLTAAAVRQLPLFLAAFFVFLVLSTAAAMTDRYTDPCC